VGRIERSELGLKSSSRYSYSSAVDTEIALGLGRCHTQSRVLDYDCSALVRFRAKVVAGCSYIYGVTADQCEVPGSVPTFLVGLVAKVALGR
jgi:hypothetical protein